MTNRDPRYFINGTVSESEKENDQRLFHSFTLPSHSAKLQKLNISFNNKNDNDKNNRQDEILNISENNEIIEQANYQNSSRASNLYSRIYDDYSREFEISQLSEFHEDIGNFNLFKEGIKDDNNGDNFLNSDISSLKKENMSKEILFNGTDIDDSFIVEQFCVEELIFDKSEENNEIPILFKNEKENNKEKKIDTSFDKCDKKEKKKILLDFVKRFEEDDCKNKIWVDEKKQSFGTKENHKDNQEKSKSPEKPKKKIEFITNKQLKDINNLKKVQKDKKEKKVTFLIENKNKSFTKEGLSNENKNFQENSNSSTKDSKTSNISYNISYKGQINTSSNILKTENLNNISCITFDVKNKIMENISNWQKEEEKVGQIFNIAKISKDNPRLNKSLYYNSVINDSNINKSDYIKNNLSFDDIIKFPDKIKKLEDKLLTNKRNRVKDELKPHMSKLYDFEKNIYREFRIYLFEKKEIYKKEPSLDIKFWELIDINDISKTEIEIEGNKYKDYTHELMKYLFSKDGIPKIYEEFLKDNTFHKNYISKNAKRQKYKNYESYEKYRNNFHKIYCDKYEENDLDL